MTNFSRKGPVADKFRSLSKLFAQMKHEMTYVSDAKMVEGVLYYDYTNDVWKYLSGTTVREISFAGELYQGVIACAANPNYPAGEKDWYWRVSTAGKIGGASGIEVEVGDMVVCITTSVGGTEAAVGASYMIVQKNMVAATVAQLRTGTDNSVFVSPKTLADQKITFSDTGAVVTLTPTTGQKGLHILHATAVEKSFTITTTSVVASAAYVTVSEIALAVSANSAVNMVEMSRFVLTTAFALGNWANAIMAKIDFEDTGRVTGLAGVVCAELNLPTSGVAGAAGTYTCFEAEIGMKGVSNGVPVSAMNINVWGDQVADFDTNGFILDLTGVSVGSGKVFQVNTAIAASHALRIRIGGVPYYIMLTNAGA